MLCYYLKWRNNAESKNLRGIKTKRRKPMLLSKFAVYDSKKLRFSKKQEANGLILRSNVPLRNASLLEAVF